MARPTAGGSGTRTIDLGQLVGAAIGGRPQLCRPAGLLSFGQAAPAGVAHGDAGDPGHQQPVTVRPEAITSHPTRIEHRHDKSKLALTASRHWLCREETVILGQEPRVAWTSAASRTGI